MKEQKVLFGLTVVQSLEEVRSLHSKRNDVVVITRHGKKAPQDEFGDVHLTTECQRRIRKYGLPGLGTSPIDAIHPGSILVRTFETGGSHLGFLVAQKLEEMPVMDGSPSAALGSNEMFAELYTKEVLDNMKEKKLTNFGALMDIPSAKEVMEKKIPDMLEIIQEMLNNYWLPLMPCHSPTVEMIAWKTSGTVTNDINIPECGSIFIVGDDVEEPKAVYLLDPQVVTDWWELPMD